MFERDVHDTWYGIAIHSSLLAECVLFLCSLIGAIVNNNSACIIVFLAHNFF